MTNRINTKTFVKIAIIVLALAMIFIVALPGRVFGEGGFELIESYPKDGANNAAVENLGAKLTFSTEVNSEANQAANSKCFRIIGPDGNDLPVKVYYNPKDATQVLVLYDITEGGQLRATNSETYQVKISGDFMDNNGNKLGQDMDITFDTINQRFNTRVYMVMMFLMIAVMAAVSMRQARKQAETNARENGAKMEPFNPYKEAKRTGKSVAEVTAAHEKEMAKLEAKEAKRRVYDEDEDDEDYEEEDNGNYKVKGPRPISEAGGKYITGRKALAEAQKAEEERLAKRRAQAKKKK